MDLYFKLPFHYNMKHFMQTILSINKILHFFFCAKYREKFILGNNIINYFEIYTIWNWEIYVSDFDEIGDNDDHIYLFIGNKTKYSPSRMIRLKK